MCMLKKCLFQVFSKQEKLLDDPELLMLIQLDSLRLTMNYIVKKKIHFISFAS